ncbi:MAG TPA: BON domain-containing protein [Stellaceae bacterium]|nr:BON domain-containing protein [Stellaceae bacterium]
MAVIGGVAAAGGAGYEAAQERGINGTFDDMNLQARINNALNNQYGTITTTVYGGRVLLTGSSPTQAAKAQAVRVARQMQGANQVFDEIAVAPDEDAVGLAKDSWITTRVRSDLMFDKDVRSNNYTIETDRQSVYLMGSARSQPELDRATQLARYVPGVQRVVSYVEVRYGDPSAAGPATAQAGPSPSYSGGPSYSGRPGYGAQPPGYGGMPPSGPPAGNAPIQVQKLQ